MLYKRYKGILEEALSSKYPVKETKPSDPFYMPYPGIKSFNFTTEEGYTYLILHSKNPVFTSEYYNDYYSEALNRKVNLYSLDFVRLVDATKPFSMDNAIQTISASRNFMKVFATVIDQALSFYSGAKIDLLTIGSKNDEPGRASLYKILANKFATKGDGTYIGKKEVSVMGNEVTQHIVLKNNLIGKKEEIIEEFDIDST